MPRMLPVCPLLGPLLATCAPPPAPAEGPVRLERALENRRRLLALNPNMKLLLEIRWRDAPGTFLPDESE